MINNIYNIIKSLANKYSEELKRNIEQRINEMESDDISHFLIYNVLGITNEEGKLIDIYQNKGRFLYKYAGSFLEECAMICIKSKYNDSKKVRIPNTLGSRPKSFEIDCLVNTLAIEIKWRDATTDGDHITKEHTRLKVIKNKGFTPIRIMFYYPQRYQAIKIQETLETLYQGLGGYYYYGDNAWKFIFNFTDVNLFNILNDIANERNNIC